MIIHFRTVIYVCKNLWSVIRNQWICRRALAATDECLYPDLSVIATVFDAFAHWHEASSSLRIELKRVGSSLSAYQVASNGVSGGSWRVILNGKWRRLLKEERLFMWRHLPTLPLRGPPSTIDGKRLIFDGFLNFQKYARITPVNSSNSYWR